MSLETKLENDGEADIETSDGVMKILRPMVKYFKVKKKVQEEKDAVKKDEAKKTE